MTDAQLEECCNRLQGCLMLRGAQACSGQVSAVVDFSVNKLTAVGVQCLLDLFVRNAISVTVLKLHHNSLRNGDHVAEFLVKCGGSLKELHLSHNFLGIEAAWDIIRAVALATDAQGRHLYPGRHGQPLWLWLGHNCLNFDALFRRLLAAAPELRRPPQEVVCQVDSSRPCTARRCCCPGGAPAIHLVASSSQAYRRKTLRGGGGGGGCKARAASGSWRPPTADPAAEAPAAAVRARDSAEAIEPSAGVRSNHGVQVTAVHRYQAEGSGYLSVEPGAQLVAALDAPEMGGEGCAWTTYVLASRSGTDECESGWVPQKVLWQRYVDGGTGRPWVYDEGSGAWCWEDALAERDAVEDPAETDPGSPSDSDEPLGECLVPSDS